MFNSIAHTYIDTIQTGKKVLIGTTIKHNGLANIYNSFVDSQTAYTKEAVNTGIKSMSSLYLLMIAPNFGKDLVESYSDISATKKATTKASVKE